MANNFSLYISLKKGMIILLISVILIYYTIYTTDHSLLHPHMYVDARGVIVTLMRSTNRSILLTINMIHSVMHFHSVQTNSSYPFLIFHDQNFTSQMQQYILSCVQRNNTQLNISFVLINFTTSVKPLSTSDLGKSMEYRLMCRFWTYDVFYHPTVRNGGYDYLMRMDDDSYFSDNTQEDLFEYTKRKNLDYAYRALYNEAIEPLKPLLQHLFIGKPFTITCIYNNFFIIRLKWYYESEQVQHFIRELVEDDYMLREYIGDGCAHAVMLLVDKQVKVKRLTYLSYGHNYHLMSRKQDYWKFTVLENFYEEIKKSCHQLAIIDGIRHRLKGIQL
ncbi:hypothetical protein I4U23_020576 [Adineta vaga]|nr:hypothetical protein I4U23_020576 [Adineta vaga]